jgi:signal transduction histidine kinase
MTDALPLALLDLVPGWLLACSGWAFALGLCLLQRRPRPEVPHATLLERLWAAIGKPPADVAPDAAWERALGVVEQQRDLARRTQRLLLNVNLLSAERTLLASVLDALGDGVVVLDRSERILYANTIGRRILSVEGVEQPTLEHAQANPEVRDAIRSVLKADLARNVKSRRVQWREGDVERSYVVRCVTRGSAEPSEHDLLVLEDLTTEETNARAKSDFIYGVSHELKTPLTSIQASLEMLTEDEQLGDEERERLLDLSLAESHRLSRMVRELLDLARVEAGITEFKLTRVEMGTMLAGLHDLHRPLAERESISLTWDISDYLPAIVGDPNLLRQAFVNLVGNAVKYTRPGGAVAVQARLEGSELVVRIQDNGIGIAPADLPRIFDKFFRAGTAQARAQGTGLGLPMARYIIERHRGRIEVSSTPDVGSEFVVYLPVVTADADADDVQTALLSVDGVSR